MVVGVIVERRWELLSESSSCFWLDFVFDGCMAIVYLLVSNQLPRTMVCQVFGSKSMVSASWRVLPLLSSVLRVSP